MGAELRRDERRRSPMHRLGLLAVAALGFGVAPTGFEASALPSTAIGAQGGPGAVTLERIAQAESSLSLRIGQVRRVLAPGASSGAPMTWTSMLESLTVSPDAVSGEPRFRLEFEGIEGTSVDPRDLARRRELFSSYSGYLHLYASLRIDDPVLAAQNYAIVHLDNRERLGRATERIALLPRRLGRNPWVVEVDAETAYPLFRAEFNAAGILVSTLEVTRFEVVQPQVVRDTQWWRPAKRIEFYPTVELAVAAIPEGQFTLPRSSDLPTGYQFSEARVVREDLRPEVNLVLVYSDGIDEIFVVQTLNAPAPQIPAASGSNGNYAILVYQDQNIAQMMFHTRSVRTLVIGRAGQFLLGSLATELLVRSLRTN